jgi:hypothetical protein
MAEVPAGDHVAAVPVGRVLQVPVGGGRPSPHAAALRVDQARERAADRRQADRGDLAPGARAGGTRGTGAAPATVAVGRPPAVAAAASAAATTVTGRRRAPVIAVRVGFVRT